MKPAIPWSFCESEVSWKIASNWRRDIPIPYLLAERRQAGAIRSRPETAKRAREQREPGETAPVWLYEDKQVICLGY